MEMPPTLYRRWTKPFPVPRAVRKASPQSRLLNYGYLVLAAIFMPIALQSGTPPGRVRAVTPSHSKLIALTFDDGPKPYVLFGTPLPGGVRSPSLLNLLDREHIKATFFVMGWRLSKNADAFCRKNDGGIPCRKGVEEEHRQGYEVENHTYGHGDFRRMEKRYGEAWILNDIDRASRIIQSLTGTRPEFVRPPDWDIWPELEKRIEARGYYVMTKSRSRVAVLRDVDSEDYFCAGPGPSKCPKPSLDEYVLRRIERREQEGIYDHILAFHELPNSVEVLARLIPQLKQRGYRFVTLRAYLQAVTPQAK